MAQAKQYPIIYVRGYAMTEGERDETTADPFCGFNLGSTVYRATADKKAPPRKFIFESPVLRLMSDFGYRDVYENGLDIMDPEWPGTQGDAVRTLALQSIIIYRYYDDASSLLGNGETPDIETFAKDLSALILRVRELVCARPENQIKQADFRCFLVAHSMGGLIARAFLQNPKLGDDRARKAVDKVFTYGTPHNGIELAGFNVPKWMKPADMNNFNRERMAKYLNLEALQKKIKSGDKRVDWLPESAFPIDRFFCMIGTNRGDYNAGMGLSRMFAGHGSDGLVKVENASVWGVDNNGAVTQPCPTAYAYRAHSGYFGIVNSEESYQNLRRFLFGDIRVDIWLDVETVKLPPAIAKKAVNALYQFELQASPRGKRWSLTRRMAEEDSVACRTHQQLMDKANKADRQVYLSTVFLENKARVNTARASLAYAMTLGVRVPDYEVEKKFWADTHYEGGYLFRDTMVVEMTPPQAEDQDWQVQFDWQSDVHGQATQPLAYKTLQSGKLEMNIPFGDKKAPGIEGKVRFIVSAWNL
jgi:PGAP1-like protein